MKLPVALSLLALAAAAPVPDAGRLAFPLAGVSFDPPAGVGGGDAGHEGQDGRHVHADAHDATSLVTVEAAKPSVGPDAHAAAASLAKGWGGTVDPAATTLGGTPAWHVSVPPPTGTALRPGTAVVGLHDGLLYLILGGATAGHPCADVVERVRASWQWQPIERPAAHLSFADQPLPAFKGAALIDVPRFAYLHSDPDPGRVLDLSLSDPQRNAPAFLAYAQLAPVRPRPTSPPSRTPCPPRPSSGPTWRPLHLARREGADAAGHHRRRRHPRRPDGRPASVVWGLVRLDADRAVLVNFTICTDDPADVAACLAAAGRMVASVRVP